MAKQSVRRSECPISFGLDLFGDKWTLLVLRDLLLFNRTHFREFAVRERIAPNILADRLSRLETAGVITKKQDEMLKNQTVYRPTAKGHAMLPMIVEMMLWGLRYDEQTPASQEFVRRLAREHEQIAREAIRAAEDNVFEEYRAKEMAINSSLYEDN